MSEQKDKECKAAPDAPREAAEGERPAAQGALEAAAACGTAGAGSCAAAGGCTGCGPRGKLYSYNYLEDIPGGYADDDMVEVLFKNTRKGYYVNSAHIPLKQGDMVAVEAAPGHDIGMVSLTGALVPLQMRKANIKPDAEKHRVFRKAKASDLERYEQAKARENDTMIRARRIASSLQLNMKIGDVEYQGDGNKAIFYYIADERVDFRQLIKVLAETFKVRIEMKQIGARQEAGRIGGIGPCGRPLCCSTWMTNFVSVSTGAARYQDISLNPQKLAGQCAKLKCCLNFEVDAYVEASRKLPGKDVRLETADSTYFFFKADIFKGEITYSTDKNIPANLVTISAERAWAVAAMNKAGEKPQSLLAEAPEEKKTGGEYADILGQDSLTRFDKKKKKKRPEKERKAKAAPAEKPANAQENGSAGKAAEAPADKPAQGAGDKAPEAPKQQRRDRGQRQERDRKPSDGSQQPRDQRQKRRPQRGPRQGNGNNGNNGNNNVGDAPKPAGDAPKPSGE